MRVLSITPLSTAGINNRRMKSNTMYVGNSISTVSSQPSFNANKARPLSRLVKGLSSVVGAKVSVDKDLYRQLGQMCISPNRAKKWQNIARDIMEGDGRELDGKVQSFKQAAEKAGVKVKVKSKFRINREDDTQGAFKEMTLKINARPSVRRTVTKGQGFRSGESTLYIDEMNLGNKGYKTDGFIRVLMKGLDDAIKNLNPPKNK